MLPDLDAIDDDAPLFSDDMSWDDADEADDEESREPDTEDDDARPRVSDSFLELDSWEEEPRSIFRELDDIDPELSGDESWAEALLRDLEEEEKRPKPAPPRLSGREILASVPEIDDLPTPPAPGELVPQRERDADISAPLDTPPLHAGPAPAAGGSGHRHPLLPDLEPEPLELPAPRRGRHANLLYGLGCLLALLLLAGQWLHARFDSLAHGPARPALASACQWLGCELPVLQDLERIRVNNLMVREHPREANALAVDVILTNQAGFAQPYPALDLHFSGIDGELLAARRFQPREYLAGELSGAREMPPRQPVHIALELVNPGERALNYTLQLVVASNPEN